MKYMYSHPNKTSVILLHTIYSLTYMLNFQVMPSYVADCSPVTVSFLSEKITPLPLITVKVYWSQKSRLCSSGASLLTFLLICISLSLELCIGVSLPLELENIH